MDTVDIIRRVVARLESWDVPVAFHPEWEGHGRPPTFTPRVVRNHHTATKGYAYDYPSLTLVHDGRSDLAGPLCQWGIGRHTGTVYVVASGTANDGGPGSWNGITGNSQGWGIEMENDGIGEVWSPAIRRSALLLNVALCLETPIDPANVCEHYEWSIYKIDRAHLNEVGDVFRAEVAELVAAGGPGLPHLPDPPDPPEEDMRTFTTLVVEPQAKLVVMLPDQGGDFPHKRVAVVVGAGPEPAICRLVVGDGVPGEAGHWRGLYDDADPENTEVDARRQVNLGPGDLVLQITNKSETQPVGVAILAES